MNRWLILTLSCLAGCGGLPQLTPVQSSQESKSILQSCEAVFPRGVWQSTHAIDASMPFGNNTVLLGVTTVQKHGFRSVLMSPEGLVLFDGELDKDRIVVHRAVPPLDRSGFAEGLMGDVRSVFFRPNGQLVTVGKDDAGSSVCRWTNSQGMTVDVLLASNAPSRIRTFGGTSLQREAKLSSQDSAGFFQEVELRVPGMGGYVLLMKLVEQDTAPAQLPPQTVSKLNEHHQ